MRMRKNKGTALLSTVIVLSLCLILGSYMILIMKDSISLEKNIPLRNDRYVLSDEEEDSIFEFMKYVNKKKNKSDEETNKSRLFDGQILEKDKSTLKYDSEADNMMLTYYGDEIIEERVINYSIKKGEVILIPTYIFHKRDEKG